MASQHQLICDQCDRNRPSIARGLCTACYERFKRHGKLDSRPRHKRGPVPGDPDRLAKTAHKRNRHEIKSGYVRVPIDDGYDFEHRVVMSEIIGRPLQPSENVHHKNGVRNDNRPENLELWCTYQPAGQRVSDLIDYLVEFHREALIDALKDSES